MFTEPETGAFEFDDFFTTSAEDERTLQALAGRLAPDAAPIHDFTPDADEYQLRFINSPAEVIRLLAPAGSGKTQSIANRVAKAASAGDGVANWLLLTFDNAAATALRAKLDQVLVLLCEIVGFPSKAEIDHF